MNDATKKLAEYVDVEIEGLDFILGRLSQWQTDHMSVHDNLSHHMRGNTSRELDIALAIYKTIRR